MKNYAPLRQAVNKTGSNRRINLRRQADIQLQDSEQQYRMVWEAAGDAMALVDRRGIVLAANPAFLDLFGLSRKIVIEKRFTDFVPKQILEKLETNFQSALSDEPLMRLERQFSRRMVSPIVVDARITSLTLDGQKPMLLAIVRDITEQKRAETALQKARDQLITLLAVSQNMISTLDLDPLLNLVLDQLGAVIRYDAAAILNIHYNRIEPLVYRGAPVPEECSHCISISPIILSCSNFREPKKQYIRRCPRVESAGTALRQ